MSSDLKRKARLVYKRLQKLHPDAHCELNYRNPLQLMVATILSAQCTDVMVNRVTKVLFKKYKSAKDYAETPLKELEQDIRSIGLFRSKAKNIKNAATIIVGQHAGKVPKTLDELVALPGIGRKTANVVLGNAFNIPGLPVDTHVKRVSNRIGLTEQIDPVKIELELNERLKAEDWTQFSHTVIFHGRRVCGARNPKCSECSIIDRCDFYQQEYA